MEKETNFIYYLIIYCYYYNYKKYSNNQLWN